jgi:hypothetical protein
VAQIKYYLSHKKVNNVFLTDAQKIARLLVRDRVVIPRRDSKHHASASRHDRFRRRQEDSLPNALVFNPRRRTVLACANCGGPLVLDASKSADLYYKKMRAPTQCKDCRPTRPPPRERALRP